MVIPIISATVLGRPALLTTSGAAAELWKTTVWNAVAAAWSGRVIGEPCAVDLRFRVPRAWYAQTALANLLKSTIDGLGRAVFAHAPSGQPGPWSTEDWWICELLASKAPSNDSGVEITIGAVASVTDTERDCIEIARSPAVWIGSGERAWRIAVADAVRARELRDLPPNLGVDFDFTLESGRMQSADIDNLCLPAAQATHDGLFGDYRPGQGNRIVAIRANKSESSEVRPPGLRIAFFDADRYRTL